MGNAVRPSRVQHLRIDMIPLMDFTLSEYLETRGRLVDEALDTYLPPASDEPRIIHEAMRYSVFAGGKRLRPILVLAGAEACGGDPAHALPVACAVEIIHTYSLIHDDLPAMDNSDTRRGRPTCHIVFGEAIAVLTGDALHALAFALIADAAKNAGADRALAVSREIAGAIGTGGMVGGQVLDLLGEGGKARDESSSATSPSELVREIHLRKTGKLIRASVLAGAMLAGADERALAALGRYGEQVGLAFQIVDDILDVVGVEAAVGKRLGGDAARLKLTYPGAFGVERSRELAADLTMNAITAISSLGPRGRILRELADDMRRRER
ncbi:MAG TPA: farnesyl diphosphate synthase [bacterium]|nr:farnesyl diphosphate synthase [bacterium]